MRHLALANIAVFFILCGLLLLSFGARASTHPPQSLMTALLEQAPALNPEVLQAALTALDCADDDAKGRRLTVIDYSLPSSQRRLWLFDLASRKLLMHELVAHGKHSGNTRSTKFSNQPGSRQSSIGLFRTLQAYHGRNGYSLRMEGLEDGYNHQALRRAIVVHGANYVSESFIRKTGRIGRSWGCPAVPADKAETLINLIKDGNYVYSWYPDPNYLAESELLQCPQPAQLAAR